VAILGDTIASHPLAPLALDCDMIAHEATFMSGEEAEQSKQLQLFQELTYKKYASHSLAQ